jgi:hypothetical protein
VGLVLAIVLVTGVVAVRSPALAADTYHVKLPYPAGSAYALPQGNLGRFTHCRGCVWGEEYAFDFALADGDPVAAAHEGKVTHVRDDRPGGGCAPSYANEANYIVIDHGDGTTALYLHLLQNTVLVSVGQQVSQGQVIASADHSGWTCNGTGGPGPHLHFQVQQPPCHGDVHCTSIPVHFDDLGRDGVTLAGGPAKHVSGNATLEEDPYVLSVDGIGPYRIGSTRADLIAAGLLVPFVGGDFCGYETQYADGPGGELIYPQFQGGRLVAIGTGSPEIRSPAGARVEMTLDELLRVYPAGELITYRVKDPILDEWWDATAVVVRFGDRGELYSISDYGQATVSWYMAGDVDAVINGEIDPACV